MIAFGATAVATVTVVAALAGVLALSAYAGDGAPSGWPGEGLDLAWLGVAAAALIITGAFIWTYRALRLALKTRPRRLDAILAAQTERQARSHAAVCGNWAFDVRRGTFLWACREATTGTDAASKLPHDFGSFLDAVHPSDRERVQIAFEQAIDDGESCDVQMRMACAHCPERAVRMRGQMMPESRFHPRRLVGTIESEVVEGAREAATAAAAQAWDQSAVGMLLVDHRCRVIQMNEALRSHLGCAAQQVMGRPARVATAPGWFATTYRTIAEAVAGGRTWQGEVPLREAFGGPRPIRVVVSPLRSRRGRVVGAQVSLDRAPAGDDVDADASGPSQANGGGRPNASCSGAPLGAGPADCGGHCGRP